VLWEAAGYHSTRKGSLGDRLMVSHSWEVQLWPPTVNQQQEVMYVLPYR
jgi:hypothetical protein